jgi:crotonobetainyl-CoA:carnitine CoA-transferase CaiB-like acyl-CoA transferase
MTGASSQGSFLNGVRVLELADELGEYCGKLLAGLGADVIKVEPLGGEGTRLYGPFYQDVVDPNRSLYFWHYNFGKRSVTMDLDTAEGQAQFRHLVVGADVLVDTRPRDYLSSRGLGYEILKAGNPGLIHARTSAFGDDGPWADYKASDLVHLALGGIVMNCGYDPTSMGEYDTPPVAPQMWQAYHITGELSAIAIIAALYYKLQSGRGQQLSTAVHEAVAKNTETDLPDWVYQRSPHNRLTGRHSFAVYDDDRRPASPRNSQTKDGRWVLPYQTYLTGAGSPHTRPAGVEGTLALLRDHGMGNEVDPESAGDKDFIDRLRTAIGKLVNAYKLDHDIWHEAQELGLPWAPVRKPEENITDPHWSRRETFVEVEHQEVNGVFTEIGARWLAPGLPWRTGPRAPLIGEHTAEVLAEAGLPREPLTAKDTTRRQIPGTEVSKFGKPWALADVRVVDLGWILASAGGGRFLAALGAEVIKVEHVSHLDKLRFVAGQSPDGGREEREAATAPIRPAPTKSLNRGGVFMENNTGKRAISLNLKSEAGKALLKALLKDADILVEGYSPGTMQRMGLGWDVLHEVNPRLVYVQQSGMGQHGQYGRMRTYGPTAQAMSGITELSGLPEPYPPAGIGYSYLDWFGAYQVALAMLAGLYRRKITGEGCWIDSSQVEAGTYLTGTAVLDYSANGRHWSRYGNRSPYKLAAPHGIYPVAGTDRWIAVSAFTQDEWLALVRVLQAPGLAADPRFTTLDHRLAAQDNLDPLIAAATAGWDAVALMTALQDAGVPAGICETAQDRVEWDPQLAHLGWLAEFTQSEIGRWPAKTPPTKYSETPAYQGGIIDRHGPSYGEDNHYVYSQILGLDHDEIEKLTQDGVI